jgi:hypothetical protein
MDSAVISDTYVHLIDPWFVPLGDEDNSSTPRLPYYKLRPRFKLIHLAPRLKYALRTVRIGFSKKLSWDGQPDWESPRVQSSIGNSVASRQR